jgi:outer membrane protein
MRSLAHLILLSIAMAAARAEDAVPLTAARTAELALGVAPEVAAARVGQAIAAADVRAAYAFVYPHLSASASYTRANLDYQEVPVFGRVAFNREDDWRAGVVLEQFLYTHDRLDAARDADRELVRIAEHELGLSRRDVAYAAKVAFEAGRLARARLAIAVDRMAQRRGERDDVQALVTAGRARSTDGNLAEIALAQVTDEHAAAESALESARIRLAALVGLEPAAVPPLAQEPLPRPDLASLLATASGRIGQTGEAAGLDLARRYEAAVARLEDSQDRPMLGLRATYGADGPRHDDLEDTWTAGVALTWNLYDGGGTIARTERWAQRSRQLGLRREAVSRDNRIALDQARSEAASLERRLTLARQVVDLATATYEDARAQYRAGRLTLVQVGDSSVRLGEARYRLLSLLYQEAVLGHEIARLAE